MSGTPFTEKHPPDGAYVLVFCQEWPAPKLMLFEERGAFRHPQLTDQSEGRWYWYPERMSWSLAALKEPQP